MVPTVRAVWASAAEASGGAPATTANGAGGDIWAQDNEDDEMRRHGSERIGTTALYHPARTVRPVRSMCAPTMPDWRVDPCTSSQGSLRTRYDCG